MATVFVTGSRTMVVEAAAAQPGRDSHDRRELGRKAAGVYAFPESAGHGSSLLTFVPLDVEDSSRVRRRTSDARRETDETDG